MRAKAAYLTDTYIKPEYFYEFDIENFYRKCLRYYFFSLPER